MDPRLGWSHPVWRSGLLGSNDGVRKIIEMASSRAAVDKQAGKFKLSPVVRSVAAFMRLVSPEESPSECSIPCFKMYGWTSLFHSAGSNQLMSVIHRRFGEFGLSPDDAQTRLELAQRLLPPSELSRIWNSSASRRVTPEGRVFKQRKAESRRRALLESTTRTFAMFSLDGEEPEDHAKITAKYAPASRRPFDPLDSSTDLLGCLRVDMAAVTIQKAVRVLLARKRRFILLTFSRYLQDARSASQHIQTQWHTAKKADRAFVQKATILVTRARHRAAIKVQQAWRDCMAHDETVKEHLAQTVQAARHYCACKIQAFRRGYVTRRIFDEDTENTVLFWEHDVVGRVVEIVGSFTNPPWTRRILMKYCPLRRKYQTVIPRMEGLLELKYLVDGQVLCSGSLDRCIDKNDPTKLNNIVYVKPVDPKLKAVRNCRKIVRSFANKKHSLPCGPLPEVDQPLQDKLWSAAPGLKHKPPRRLMSRMSSQQAGERDARIKHMLLDGRRNAARMLHSHSGRVTAAEDISPVTLPTENVQSDRCGFVSSPEAAEQSNVDDEVAPVRTCRSAGRTCGLGQRAPIVQVMARRAPIGEPAQDDVKESHDREAAVYSICEDDSRQTPIADREAAVYSICEDDVRQTPIAHPEAAIDLIHQDDVRQTSIINREAGIAQAEIRQTSTTDQQAAKAAVTEAAIKQGTVTDSSHIELAAHEAVVLASGALTTADRIGCEVMELDVPSDTDPREGYDDPLNTATTTAGSLSHLEASETAGNVVTRRGDSSRRRKRKRNKKSSEKSTPLQQRTPTASVTEPVTPERPPLSPPVHSLTQPASPLRGGSLSPALLFGRQSPNSMGPRSDDGSYTRLSTFGSYDTRFHRTFFLDEEDPVLHRLYIQRKEQIERRHRQGRRHR